MELKNFSQILFELNQWHHSLNNISQNEKSKYFISLPRKTIDKWQDDFKDRLNNLDEQRKLIFNQMFTIGGTIFGFKVLAFNDSDYLTIYKLNESEQNFILNNFLCSYDGNILNNITNNIILEDNTIVDLPNIIKYGSIKLTNIFNGIDRPLDQEHGIILSEEYVHNESDDNRINSESISGTINYRTGAIHLVRSNKENEEFFENPIIVNSSDTENENKLPYNYATINVTFIKLGEPITKELMINIYS